VRPKKGVDYWKIRALIPYFVIVVLCMEFQDSLDPLPSLERSEAYSPENIETKSVA